MSILLVQSTIHGKSGLPTDVYTNTWHFNSLSQLSDEVLGNKLDIMVRAFYSAVAPKMSPELGGQALEIKCYDFVQPKPRAPFFTNSLGFPNSGGGQGSLPAEVALCLSYSAASASGSIAARRRGRIYVGPMGFGSGVSDVNGSFRPSPATITAFLGAADDLVAACNTALVHWIVYSPRTAGAVQGDEAAGFTVTHAYVDNAYDTQRRRGVLPTSRDATELVQTAP